MEEKIYLREHLSLTPFEPGDQTNLVRYLNDPELYRNTLRIPSPYTEADADQWINMAQENRALHGKTYNWAIRHKAHGVIGGIGAFLHTGVDGHLDEIGYWLGAPFRGQGIATNAVHALCDWLFESRPPLVRIEAKVHSDNPASARVLEKAGFEREGFARKHTIKNGELIDVILMARIRE
ncbi:MAG: GNAT family N-acetyltransferase [Saprospiraceae bacterium]|nr:GNAT family N-acetyltransferase [Saprospiraceae bacterium]